MASPQSRRCAALALVAASLALGVLPARAASDSCSFRSRSLSISVPDIRPDQGLDVVATSAGFQVGDCVPAVRMQVRMDDGQHAANGRRRMKHATREAYLPYTLSLAPPGLPSATMRGPGPHRYISQGLRLHIQGAALADLPAGDYCDFITLTVTP